MEGPEMVKAEKSTWPAQRPNDEVTGQKDELERRKAARTNVTNKCKDSTCIDPSQFPNFQSLIRVTGWIQRFLVNCRLPDASREKGRMLGSNEIKRAETFWLNKRKLTSFLTVQKRSSWSGLNPKMTTSAC